MDAIETIQSPLLGIDCCTKGCWEYGAIVLGESEPLGRPAGLHILSAWFGDPDDQGCQKDITSAARELLASQNSLPVEFPATTKMWGDPARFRMKRLEVTYQHVWLDVSEREALQALQRRVSEKAQNAPDLEELVKRLG